MSAYFTFYQKLKGSSNIIAVQIEKIYNQSIYTGVMFTKKCIYNYKTIITYIHYNTCLIANMFWLNNLSQHIFLIGF